MNGYPLERIYEEVAFIAYHFKWSYEELMEMDHAERRKWCLEISRMNRSMNEANRLQ